MRHSRGPLSSSPNGSAEGFALCRGRGGVPHQALRAGGRGEQRSSNGVTQRPRPRRRVREGAAPRRYVGGALARCSGRSGAAGSRRRVSLTKNARTAAEATPVNARNANAAVNPDIVVSTAKLSGFERNPACVTIRPTPKKRPRAPAGAMSVPIVCIDPARRLPTSCIHTKADDERVEGQRLRRRDRPGTAWPCQGA